jgi:uncharacterized protein YpmB
MKKWLMIISVLIILAVVATFVVYFKAVEPVKAAEEKAVLIAKEEVGLNSVNEFNIYNAEDTYYVLQGENKKGTKLVIWIPEKKGKVIVKKASEGISKQQATKKVLEEIGSDEIISVKLGIESGVPIWEIHSRTKGNLLNYHSVVFETGEWVKKIENL